MSMYDLVGEYELGLVVNPATGEGKETEDTTIVCPLCLKEVGEFKDAVSVEEYHISGLCQSCQDSVFKEGED